MSELITETEAFLAWKKGHDVEIYDESECWHPLHRDHGLCVFDSNGRVKFRLKPKTITINGVEVPAPFEPKDGDKYYYPKTGNAWGFACGRWGNDAMQKCYIQFGAWRTEEEIKQVVEALRNIFK